MKRHVQQDLTRGGEVPREKRPRSTRSLAGGVPVLKSLRSPCVGFVLAAPVIVLLAALLAASAAASGRLAWSSPQLVDRKPSHGPAVAIDAISCPSASLCVAVDRDGDVVTAHSMRGRFGRWRTVLADPARVLEAISCPSTALCVAV